MMTKFLICLASVALVALVATADDVYERKGHLNDQREQLGHFKHKPFIDLYSTYSAAFELNLHPDRVKDDYRNFMPTADKCIVFLKKFRIDKYKLNDVDELVVLDGCLGYLFDNNNKALDGERLEIKQLEEIQELRNLFEGTDIDNFSQEGKECIADLLLNVIIAKYQFKDVVCNNHWLQVFIQFAECQSHLPKEGRNSDTYLKILYDLVRERVNTCVDYEVGHIEVAVRKAYAKQRVIRLANTIRSKFGNSLAAEEKQRMWPHEVTVLLAAVQNTTDQVNQRQVHKLIRGVITNDEQLKTILLNNMAEYATKQIKPKARSKANREDPTGMVRYTRLIDSMCNFFRSSDQESIFDFATPIIRLVQLLAHEDLFQISQQQFITKMLTRAMESAPIYLSVQACNILTYTEGAINMPQANTKQSYKVVFKPDTSGMILWPDAGYY